MNSSGVPDASHSPSPSMLENRSLAREVAFIIALQFNVEGLVLELNWDARKRPVLKTGGSENEYPVQFQVHEWLGLRHTP